MTNLAPVTSTPARVYYLPPTECPECNSALVTDGEYLLCVNEDCPAVVMGRVLKWINGLGLLEWGKGVLEPLMDSSTVSVNDAADLYALKVPDIANQIRKNGARVGESTAQKLIDILAAEKEIPLNVFVGSLGIHLCARSACKLIVQAGFDSLDKMEAATEAEIAVIPGMGNRKAHEFVKGLELRAEVIEKLLNAGITVKAPSDGAFKGKTACFTGFRNPTLEKRFEALGGSMSSSAKRGLTWLVAKDAKGSSGKLKAARDKGIEVIGMDDFVQSIEDEEAAL